MNSGDQGMQQNGSEATQVPDDQVNATGEAPEPISEPTAEPGAERPKRKRGKKDRPWPATKVELQAVSALVPSARNARLHSPDQVKRIAASIKQFGWTNPVLVAEDGEIIAGHGRVMAANRLKLEQVPVIVAVGWTEDEVRAFRVADNQLTEMGEWDPAMLKIELDALQGVGFDAEFLGFDLDKLAAMLEPVAGDEGGDAGVNAGHKSGEDRGELLSLINITINDPRHDCHLGDHYELRSNDGQAHDLMCCGVIADWKHWIPLLVNNAENAVFCPFPGVFVPFATKAKTHRLVMVQPNLYIAGHILDRWAEVHGAKSIYCVSRREK